MYLKKINFVNALNWIGLPNLTYDKTNLAHYYISCCHAFVKCTKKLMCGHCYGFYTNNILLVTHKIRGCHNLYTTPTHYLCVS